MYNNQNRYYTYWKRISIKVFGREQLIDGRAQQLRSLQIGQTRSF